MSDQPTLPDDVKAGCAIGRHYVSGNLGDTIYEVVGFAGLVVEVGLVYDFKGNIRSSDEVPELEERTIAQCANDRRAPKDFGPLSRPFAIPGDPIRLSLND